MRTDDNKGLVAQRITRLTTDQKIPGSNPGKVVILIIFSLFETKMKDENVSSAMIWHIHAVTRIRTWVIAATTQGTNHYTITAKLRTFWDGHVSSFQYMQWQIEFFKTSHRSSGGISSSKGFPFSREESLSSCGRVVKASDSKSDSLWERRFESYQLRCVFCFSVSM